MVEYSSDLSCVFPMTRIKSSLAAFTAVSQMPPLCGAPPGLKIQWIFLVPANAWIWSSAKSKWWRAPIKLVLRSDYKTTGRPRIAVNWCSNIKKAALDKSEMVSMCVARVTMHTKMQPYKLLVLTDRGPVHRTLNVPQKSKSVLSNRRVGVIRTTGS